MDAFAKTPPEWTNAATHAFDFRCPQCGDSSRKANNVWLNRRAPVYSEDHRRKWQEFYHCHCGCAWWAWSSDRPPEPELPDTLNESGDEPPPGA